MNFISKMFHRDERLSINQITKKNLPFFVGWIVIILWLDSYVLPVGTLNQAGLQPNISPVILFSYLYPFAVTAIICLFNVKKLMPYVKYSVIVAMIGIFAKILPGNTSASYVGAVLTAIAVGHIIASTDYGFFMVMNNIERLYSVSIGILISKTVFLLSVIFAGTGIGFELFGIMQLMGFVPLLICVWFYQKSAGQEILDQGIKPHLRDYTVLVLACLVFLFNDFLAPALWKPVTIITPITLNMYYIAGVFLGIVFILVLQQALRCNICYALNFSFAVLAMGFVIGALEYHSIKWILFQTLLFGISYAMGFVSIYYMIGIIAKRSQSLSFFRLGILSASILYVFGFFITELLKDVNSQSLLSATALISIAVILTVFALTPLLTKVFYSAEWTDDLYRIDVTHVSRLAARLSELKLSPREMEVCILLLDGYTMRQISAMLNISYSTVNTYYTSTYRKLGVNSRTELIVMFREYLSK
ncbi:MAG: LuxR C-terminal-related transcriptional regulator [Clostridiaceae bacterium]|nr:LuxR C-terminal-related transcriptional regulator [Clostridiaceae bacterium]